MERNTGPMSPPQLVMRRILQRERVQADERGWTTKLGRNSHVDMEPKRTELSREITTV
jgi:hypothetical protein